MDVDSVNSQHCSFLHWGVVESLGTLVFFPAVCFLEFFNVVVIFVSIISMVAIVNHKDNNT